MKQHQPKRVIEKAAEPVAANLLGFHELGSSGLRRWAGMLDEEQIRDLSGKRGVLQLKKMADYDDVAGASLFAINTVLKSANFSWQPASQTPDDLMRAEFFRQVWDDMSQTWDDLLSDICTMFTFGWANFEVVLKVRLGEDPGTFIDSKGRIMPLPESRYDDGRIGVRKLAIRAQETLDRWEFDDAGGIQGMWQNAPDAGAPVFIPIQKSLLFRTSTVKNSPEGRSLLKSGWQSWYFKTNIRTIEGIGVERDLAGYPVIQLAEAAPDIWNQNDAKAVTLRATLESIVRGIRRDEQEGAVLPHWATLSLLASGSKRNFDTGAIITRYDQRIAMTMLADFIMLGHDAVGSKALSISKVSVFTKALSGFGNAICNVINRFLVPTLMKMNGWSGEVAPTFKVTNIVNISLAEIADFIQKLTGAGMPLFPDPNLEETLLEMAALKRSSVPQGDPVPKDDDPPKPEPAPTPEDEA